MFTIIVTVIATGLLVRAYLALSEPTRKELQDKASAEFSKLKAKLVSFRNTVTGKKEDK